MVQTKTPWLRRLSQERRHKVNSHSSIWYHLQGSPCNSSSSIVALRDPHHPQRRHVAGELEDKQNIPAHNPPPTKRFLLLPLGFSARRWSAASEGSSAAAPACGSPAGRSPSRAPGPQLAPIVQ